LLICNNNNNNNNNIQYFLYQGNPLDIAGSKVGITFNKSRRVIPTMLCHRAVEWSNKSNPTEKTDLFMEKLFSAYFESGFDVSKLDQILECAQQSGIDTETLRLILIQGACKNYSSFK